jgi:hypothetical protein
MADVTRKSITEALRGAGLTHRQVRALIESGWRGLVGAEQAEADELRERLEKLEEALRRGVQ